MQLPPFVAAHKTEIAVAGAAGLAGLVVLKKKSVTSTTSGAATTGTASTGTSTAVPATGYASDPYDAAQDAYNSLEPQLESLQTQISAVTPAAASTTGTSTATAPSPYTKIQNWQQALFFRNSGATEYADEDGQFVAVSQGKTVDPNFKDLPDGDLFIKSS